MQKMLTDIINELNEIIDSINSNVTNVDGFNYSHRSWNIPGISRLELVNEAKRVVSFLQTVEIDPQEVDAAKLILERYLKSLQFLRQHTVPQLWGNSQQAVPAYLITMQSLITAIEPILLKDNSIELAKQIKNQRRRVRGLEASLNDLDPRVAPLKEMVSRIEQAHETAEQLPTDLESLSEARKSVSKFATDSRKDKDIIEQLKIEIEQIRDDLRLMIF